MYSSTVVMQLITWCMFVFVGTKMSLKKKQVLIGFFQEITAPGRMSFNKRFLNKTNSAPFELFKSFGRH